MQRLARNVNHVKAMYSHARSSDVIPHLVAADLSCAEQAGHVQHVSQFLQKRGILKVSLRFQDDASQYLHNLVLNLHKRHGHGLPITHSASHGWFWDVRPDSTASLKRQARSETMEDFPWHTDCSYEDSPPRFFALQVLQPDRCGGGTLSIMNTAKLPSLLSPSTAAALLKPEYRITIPPEFVKRDDQRYITGSLLTVDEHNLPTMVRFRKDIITPLTKEASAALKELSECFLGLEAQRKTIHLAPECLPRGSILLLDNRRWLHARNEVKDPERHLRRVRWDARPFPATCN